MADYRKIRAASYRDYLQSFPEEIYNLDDNSHVVRLLDALCGDAGVGGTRKAMLLKRMQTSLYELRYYDLDALYDTILGFPRLERERYGYDVKALLTSEQINEMNRKDASYRSRINKYVKAYQYGGTRYGIALACEAALGVPCVAVSCEDYYKSRGIVDGTSVVRSFGQGDVDYGEYVVIANIDRELTAEESYAVYTYTRRIRPANAKITVKTIKNLADDGIVSGSVDSHVAINSIESSSDWWDIVRYVTGRIDWNANKYAGEQNMWIQAGVKNEAPKQLLVNSQECVDDYTYMMAATGASSVHIGRYNSRQVAMFPSLKNAVSEMLPEYSVSAASAKRYVSSYFGGDAVIDWSYPAYCSDEIQSYANESGRYYRFWSSDEVVGGSEWIEYSIRKLVPINTIRMNVFRKPVRIIPYVSSTLKQDGSRDWRRIYNRDGVPLSYTNRTVGSSSVAGDMVTVEFSFETVSADAIRFEIERIDDSFAYSVEISALSIKCIVRDKDDFRAATFEDAFGNAVETAMVELTPSTLVSDGDEHHMWVSQPNLGESAVEYLILDVRENGRPSRLNYIDFVSVFDGCQLNIYSSDDKVNWTPYPDVYELVSGRINLPVRPVSYLKLEFTSLCAIPYETVCDGIYVKTRLFPSSVKRRIESFGGGTYVTSALNKLLMQNAPDYTDVYSEIGIGDVYSSISSSKRSTFVPGYDGLITGLFSGASYRGMEETSVYSVYGENMMPEESLRRNMRRAVVVDEPSYKYRFVDAGKHEYAVDSYERTMNLAYVVGIDRIDVGYSSYANVVGKGDSSIIGVYDTNGILQNDMWNIVEGERAFPATDEVVCSLEFKDIESVIPFRSFDFAVNQHEPTEMFEYPSRMFEEWSAFGGSDVDSVEFGVSGNVFEATIPAGSTGGIQSESKMIRGRSIANAQVDIYVAPNGSNDYETYVIECNDIYGGQVFTKSYDIQPGKWTTIGAVFTPKFSNGWWADAFAYRYMLPIVGPFNKGDNVFVSTLMLSDMAEAGVIKSDYSDLHLIYYDGFGNNEIDVDITGDCELWFSVQDDIPAGRSADGSYDFDLGRMVGAYYLYFGEDSQNSEYEPKRDIDNVFVGGGFTSVTDDYVDVENVRFADSGYVSFEIDAIQDTSGYHHIFAYEDDVLTVECYVLDDQFHFAITDSSDSFRSEFASEVGEESEFATARTMLVEWGVKGSETIYINGVESDRMNRRSIHVYVDDAEETDGYRELDGIINVYDEASYDAGSVRDAQGSTPSLKNY